MNGPSQIYTCKGCSHLVENKTPISNLYWCSHPRFLGMMITLSNRSVCLIGQEPNTPEDKCPYLVEKA